MPGLFTAKNRAPDRLWAEVSLYDNAEAIESNFGLLVGLTKEDLTKITETVNYRQAVSGLMYAFTRGSAIEKVRLGAQILLGLPFAEAGKRVSEAWKAISEEEKKIYNDKAAEDKIRYENAMKTYVPPIPESESESSTSSSESSSGSDSEDESE